METTKQISVGGSEIKAFSISNILSLSWEQYLQSHEVSDNVRQEVYKAISCKSGEKGVFVYYCSECKEYVYQLFGCNSRLCSCCGKRYTDQWAKSLSKAMFDVPHRHFVFSVPPVLWPYLLEKKKMWKDYMDSAIETCQDYFPKLMHRRMLKVGVIVVMHPFSKKLGFQPHLHIIVTEGGFDKNKDFVKQEFFPARNLAHCWQYHVSKKLQEAGIPNFIFTELYKKYDGFYVWVHRAGKIKSPKDIAKYLGRYVRHPSIANSRITDFNDKIVSFYYEEYKDGITERHNIVMEVNEFITALIQHIPPKQFKMIRYYGVYARGKKRKYNMHLQSSISSGVQDILYMPGWRSKPVCPHCGGFLKFVRFDTIPPPGDYFHWEIKRKDCVEWIRLR